MDERMLRLALMEANLERFREVLEGTDRDWNWSPRYLRSRTRLLAAVGSPGGLRADGFESQGELGLLEVL